MKLQWLLIALIVILVISNVAVHITIWRYHVVMNELYVAIMHDVYNAEDLVNTALEEHVRVYHRYNE